MMDIKTAFNVIPSGIIDGECEKILINKFTRDNKNDQLHISEFIIMGKDGSISGIYDEKNANMFFVALQIYATTGLKPEEIFSFNFFDFELE